MDQRCEAAVPAKPSGHDAMHSVQTAVASFPVVPEIMWGYCVPRGERSRRDPVCSIPPRVPLPDFLAPHPVARTAVTVAGLPCISTRAVPFSHGGGSYVRRDDRAGDKVVPKPSPLLSSPEACGFGTCRPDRGVPAGGGPAGPHPVEVTQIVVLAMIQERCSASDNKGGLR